jgi:hypothetical protein
MACQPKLTDPSLYLQNDLSDDKPEDLKPLSQAKQAKPAGTKAVGASRPQSTKVQKGAPAASELASEDDLTIGTLRKTKVPRKEKAPARSKKDTSIPLDGVSDGPETESRRRGGGEASTSGREFLSGTISRPKLAGNRYGVRRDPQAGGEKEKRKVALQALAAERGVERGKSSSVFRDGSAGPENDSEGGLEPGADDDVTIIEKLPEKVKGRARGKAAPLGGASGFRSAADVMAEMPPPKKARPKKAAASKKVNKDPYLLERLLMRTTF